MTAFSKAEFDNLDPADQEDAEEADRRLFLIANVLYGMTAHPGNQDWQDYMRWLLGLPRDVPGPGGLPVVLCGNLTDLKALADAYEVGYGSENAWVVAKALFAAGWDLLNPPA